MTLITDTWRQLVERRLWPIALLLLAALVAVPVLLASDPAPAPAPATTTASAKSDDPIAAAKPIVAQATSFDDSSRHVLGSPKDPFKPAVLPKPTPAPSTTVTTSKTSLADATAANTATSSGGSSSSSTTTTSTGTGSTPSTPSTPSGGGGTTTPPPPSSAPPSKPKAYELYSLTVRFGDASTALTKQHLKRLAPLPDADDPVAIYLGPGPDKRSAVFLVDASVTPQGDGTCKPYAADCQTVTLHEGDTEFFDVKDPTSGAVTTYELDLLNIVRKSTTSARKARTARATSKAGARALRKHLAHGGPLRWAYDRSSGTVAKLDQREWKATVARAGEQVAHVVAVLQPGM